MNLQNYLALLDLFLSQNNFFYSFFRLWQTRAGKSWFFGGWTQQRNNQQLKGKLYLKKCGNAIFALKVQKAPKNLPYKEKIIFIYSQVPNKRVGWISASRVGLANFPTYSFIWPYFFHFPPYSISKFSTLLVYLALFFYEIYSK